MQNTYFDSDAECLFLVEKVRGYFPVDYAIESSELQALSFGFKAPKMLLLLQMYWKRKSL